MAQSGYTPILIYASSTTTNVPLAANLTNSSSGAELAINYFDGKLFYKDNAGVVQVLAWKTTPTTAGGTGLTSWTAGQIPYYSSGTTLSQLNIGTNGYVLTSNGTAPTWSAPSAVIIGTATNLAGGATGSLPYQSSASTTTFLSLGTTNYVLTAGASAPQYVAQSTLSVGSATTATNVAGGTTGAVHYQTGVGSTGFLSLGTTNYVLTAGASAPQYVAQSTLSVGSATSATTSTNVSGGTVGALPYQTSTGVTSFVNLATSGQVLTAGTFSPQYVAQSTLSVGSATTATNLAGGAAGSVPYQTGSGTTTYQTIGTVNQVMTSTGSAPQWVAPSSITVGAATTATNLSAGGTGSVVYQSASGTTAYLTLGTTNYVLTAGASAPQYVAQSTLSVGSATTATTATNVTGGAAGSIVYQTGSGATSTLALGTTNYVLVAGASAPQYVAQSTLSVGSATTATTATSATTATTATTATNVAGGAAGSLVYQTGSGATTTLGLGTTNYVLVAGASAPQYVAQSTLSVGSATTATTATNIASGAANQIHYQTGAGATSFIAAPTVSSTYLGWNGSAFAWSAVAAAPGGSTTQVQYNNAGAFGGMSSVTWDGSALTIANSKLTGTTSAFASILTNAAETVNIVAGRVNSTPTAYFNTGAVQYYTTFANANWTQNLAYSSTTTLDSALAVGQSATIAILATQGSTAYYMNGTLTIDGSSSNVTTNWQGGSAPVTGFTTGIDVYTYTVIKTAATPAYTVLATQTQF